MLQNFEGTGIDAIIVGGQTIPQDLNKEPLSNNEE
jgi:hypothetical protein